MIRRTKIKNAMGKALGRSRIIALLGPRQCGKTTLARQFVSASSLNYFDLEDPASVSRLEAPMTGLQDLHGLVVIDEIQHKPELFTVLRVLADRKPRRAKFLILGSASGELLRQSSESLAGRIEIISVGGFSLEEVGVAFQAKHWLRGGFPLSYLARSQGNSLAWCKNFTQTFVQRDLPSHGLGILPATMMRFWAMLAHYHGQLWNAAEAARSLGVSESSVRRYLDVLEGAFMIRSLQPWHANLMKRQVKSPKIYFRDTGLLHYLLGLRSEKELLSHPKCGASWEGYVVEEMIKATAPDEVYFWGTHNGAELDLLLIKNGKKVGVEIKRMDAPGITPSMHIAMEDLQLERLIVIYPGAKSYPLSPRITVMPLSMVAKNTVVFA